MAARRIAAVLQETNMAFTFTLTLGLWWIPFIIWLVVSLYAWHDSARDEGLSILALTWGSMALARWLP